MQSSSRYSALASPTAVNWKLVLVLIGLVVTAYAPAINNGFISDDYVILRRTEELTEDPRLLFSTPPEPFRLTSYLTFLLLKSSFGFHASLFHVFTILLHLANVLLFWRLLSSLCENDEAAVIGAMLFAAIHNPQEAVFWLAGMNEALLGIFFLAALLFWTQGRFVLSGLSYSAALFSKESAVILPVLVQVLELWRARRFRFRKEWVSLLIPTLIFAAVYLHSAPSNALLANQLYAFKPQAAWVIINSFHRLLFPWGYIMLAYAAYRWGYRELRAVGLPLVWTGLTLLPYVFLTYQTHVPSRNQYLASMGVAWLLALLVVRIPESRWREVVVAAFVLTNIAYIWLKKDPQYVLRAAPTEQLVQELRHRTPARLRVLNFPENPWIAKETTMVVPGWKPDMLVVNEPRYTCPGCPTLAWDVREQRYTSVSDRP